jgi:hypothetical protein
VVDVIGVGVAGAGVEQDAQTVPLLASFLPWLMLAGKRETSQDGQSCALLSITSLDSF